MHRFGRSGQLKKDRWGGSFLVIAALAVGAAYLGGTYLNKYYFADKTTANQGTGTGTTDGQMVDGQPVASTVEPKAFDLYVVQVGAFNSPTGAQNTATDMQSKGQVGFARINPTGMSYAYVGGVFTAKKDAEKLLADLKEKKVVTVGLVSTVKVPYGPDVITAMAGDNKTSVKTGYTSLNTYLHEVALWIENRANSLDSPVDDMVNLGKSLGQLATQMEKAPGMDEKMKHFVAVAKEASQHSLTLDSAAKGQTGSAEYMKALSGYMSLLNNYASLQPSTTASN